MMTDLPEDEIQGRSRLIQTLRDLAPLAALGLGVLLIYRRLAAGWVLADGDLHTYFFPYWTAAARAFQAGELPLWNPYLFAGAPLLANSQAAIFYPLNWPFWLLVGSNLSDLAVSLHWSVLLHLGLAAFNLFVLARRLGVHPWGAALGGLLYAGGGFLGVHVEHLNQLQGLAWLPLVFLPPVPHRLFPERTRDGGSAHKDGTLEHKNEAPERKAQSYPSLADLPAFPPAVSVLAFAFILLTGHTQTAFIAAVGLFTFYTSLRFFTFAASRLTSDVSRLTFHVSRFTHHLFSLFLSLLPFSLAALIAAVQLLPTFELSRFSMRAGGLPWREAVSFSVVPWQIHRVLLPPYLFEPALPEGVGYIGAIGLLLAGWGAAQEVRCFIKSRRRRTEAADVPVEPMAPLWWAVVVIGGVGLFLALGGYNPLYLLGVRLGVPGLIHFRAPARYLALYTLSASLLASRAFSALPLLRPDVSRFTFDVSRLVFYAFILAELLLSSSHLPHADATDVRAYSDLRPATAHLVAAAREAESADLPAGRFLSISKTLFEPGDHGEIEGIYGPVLSPDALWAYLVAAKQREVLSPNLPLAFGVPAVDGYDGGLLPLHHYAAFSRLLLPEGTLDGRLRENLEAIPEIGRAHV